MRTYEPNLLSFGVSYDRLGEMRHRCRRYKKLPKAGKLQIDKAAILVMGKDYAWALKKNVCENVPFGNMNIPFSESNFKRRRKLFFVELDRIMEESELQAAEYRAFAYSRREEFERWKREKYLKTQEPQEE